MAAKSFRLIRWLKSICAPTTTVICFSFLLTWIFVLYQPSPGPGLIQKLGWQSWEVVSMPNDDQQVPASSNANADSNKTNLDIPQGVDWWNVTTPEEKVDSASLPLDVWAPLLPHDTGLSEITVTRCFVNPALQEDLCAPESTSEQDAIKGKWVRVARDLNLEAGFYSGWLNIYYRRTRRQDINLITSIRLLPDGEELSSQENWQKVSTSLRTGVIGSPPLYLWYRTGKTAADMSAHERSNLITEIDVIYGEDVPWYGFEKLEPATVPERGRVEATWITYRRGVKVPPRAPPLHFSRAGRFKIVQVADLHFSVSQGHCRDTSRHPCQHADNLTSSLLGRVLEAENPDLVIFTGDQLNGQGTSWDPKSVLAKFARAVTDRKIPWAAVFGNHDDEDGLKREDQITLMKSLPYSLVERGPKDVHGSGNYVLKVFSADPSKTQLLTLYFLDSGSYSRGYFDWFTGWFTPTAYDWIRQSQIDWFLQESGAIKQIERPFTPDTAKDLGHAWSRRQSQLLPDIKRLAKPNAMMFFHIPLPESYNKPDKDPQTGRPLDFGIHDQERPGNAKESDGFFEKALLKAKESDHRNKGDSLEVKVVGNGHCHITENCRRVKDIWLCFGGGGSYAGYGKIGFDRRFRVYEISDYGETIRTYKHTEHDEIVDDMVLIGRGAVAT